MTLHTIRGNLPHISENSALTVTSLSAIRSEIRTLMRGDAIVDDDFLVLEQYVAQGLVTIEFVKHMLGQRLDISLLNEIIAELIDFLADSSKRNDVLSHLCGAVSIPTISVSDMSTFAKHYKHFAETLGREGLCDWLMLCGIRYSFQAISGSLAHISDAVNMDLLMCIKDHGSVLRVILEAYHADKNQGSTAFSAFFYLNCFTIVRQPLLIDIVMSRLPDVSDVAGYIELCHSLTPFLLKDQSLLVSKIDTIIKFVNGGERDRSLPMFLFSYIPEHLLSAYPNLRPDFVFYPFTVSKKYPLVEDKVKNFVFDPLLAYVDSDNRNHRQNYIGSKLIYELNTIDKFRSIATAIWKKKDVDAYFKTTLDYLVQYKSKKLSSYIGLIHQCLLATPTLDPSVYILSLRPLVSRSVNELSDLLKDWRNGVDSFDTQVLRAVVADQGDRALAQLEMTVKKSQTTGIALNEEGQKTLIALTALCTDKALSRCDQMIKDALVQSIKAQYPTMSLSDESLLSDQIFLLYQMSISPRRNKAQTKELMTHIFADDAYHLGDNVLVSYPYSKLENQNFIDQLSDVARNVWFSENKKTYDVSSEAVSMDKDARTKHHFAVCRQILVQCGVDMPCDALSDAIDAYRYLNANRRDSRIAGMQIPNLGLQIQSIKKLQQSSTVIKACKSITIYKELDPRNICMMGERVDGSCLSFYSGVGNNRSVFTNALEANKGVCYIKDEYDTIIGRFIVAISKDQKLVYFPVYYKGYTGMDLGYYVKEYLYDLSQKMNMSLGGKSHDVDLLFCDDWYCDPEYHVDG